VVKGLVSMTEVPLQGALTVAGMTFKIVARSVETHKCGKTTYYTILRNPYAEITVASETYDLPKWLKVEGASNAENL
jgi:hypothetical protein